MGLAIWTVCLKAAFHGSTLGIVYTNEYTMES